LLHQIEQLSEDHTTTLNGQALEMGESPISLHVGDLLELGQRVFKYVVCVARAAPNEKLLQACQEGRLCLAKRLVEVLGASPDHVDSRGMTPLFHSCLRGHGDIVEWLVCSAEARLLSSCPRNRITSLVSLLDSDRGRPHPPPAPQADLHHMISIGGKVITSN